MLDQALNLLSWALLLSGSFFVIVGGIGSLRMPDLYTRMHAASVTDSMAPILILSGLMLQAGLSLYSVKLAAILVFLLLTGPTASNALASTALLSNRQKVDEEHL
ncbi:MAG: monovalent cation/H(+) antiporter subunit G [Proteobacteria bacterium]|jgi:multicomponent Na+:H+ antiporter subunit G|nr:monovalent cation/H(+) antiporter subunit G [Pseudomonadota bacterium]MDA0953249.1 monovalent cation/H(+) antiporter subunit G [Pseudomonadota bacterium]HBZ49781.1 sodium:proton antiporter [Halieaceae bacterium]